MNQRKMHHRKLPNATAEAVDSAGPGPRPLPKIGLRPIAASTTRRQSPAARFVVERPGQLTTVQDLGRPALRRAGLPCGGAADAMSLRIANLLVGNDETAACLECALVGPVLRFDTDAVIAVVGARAEGVPYATTVAVSAGERLTLSRLTDGTYAYLAVAGGIDVPVVLGGRGTDIRLQFAGFDGRPLRAGDAISCGPDRDRTPPIGTRVRPIGLAATRLDRRPELTATDPARVSAEREPSPISLASVGAPSATRSSAPTDNNSDDSIRFVDGKDAALVVADWHAATFVVSSASDRVGVRLGGTTIVARSRADAASSVVLPGTVQLPGDGVPIVLGADAQTLGGYPQIAKVIHADLPRLAQRRPGERVRLQRVSLDDAYRLAWRQERDLALLRCGLRLMLGDDAID